MVAFGYRSTRLRMGCGWAERNARMAQSVVVVGFMPSPLERPRPGQPQRGGPARRDSPGTLTETLGLGLGVDRKSRRKTDGKPQLTHRVACRSWRLYAVLVYERRVPVGLRPTAAHELRVS